MTWILGLCRPLANAYPLTGMLIFFLLLFQDLVTASIGLEPGGLNYDLDTWGCAGLLPTQIPSRLVALIDIQVTVGLNQRS